LAAVAFSRYWDLLAIGVFDLDDDGVFPDTVIPLAQCVPEGPLVFESNHRRQKTAHQKNTLLPAIGFFQFHQKSHRSKLPESMRHPHVEKAFQSQALL
jgi:hypothetical protein